MFRSSIILLVVLCLLLGADYLTAWTAPSAVPPASNVTAPINVGAATQIKSGALGVAALDVAGGAVVRGTANLLDLDLAVPGRVGAREYCDENGLNCVTTAGGGLGGGDDDTITVGGRCFQPMYAATCNWNWSGDGNDNSTYTGPIYRTPAQICAAANRSYQYHTVILGECLPDGWSRSAWVRVGTTYNYTRTVTCVEGTTGATLPDASCPAPKPAATCTVSGIFGSASGCPA